MHNQPAGTAHGRILFFGGYLVQKGLITHDELGPIMSIQRVVPEKIGQLLIREGMLSQEEMMQALSDFSQIPLYERNGIVPDQNLIRLVSEKTARRLGVIPLERNENNELLLACNGPVPRSMLQNISRLAKGPVKLVLVTERQLRRLQQAAYAREFDTRIDFRVQPVDSEDLNVIVEVLKN